MLKRYFEWTCDRCGTKITQECFGLPKNWRVAKPDLLAKLTMRQLCFDCVRTENLTEKQLFPKE